MINIDSGIKNGKIGSEVNKKLKNKVTIIRIRHGKESRA